MAGEMQHAVGFQVGAADVVGGVLRPQQLVGRGAAQQRAGGVQLALGQRQRRQSGEQCRTVLAGAAREAAFGLREGGRAEITEAEPRPGAARAAGKTPQRDEIRRRRHVGNRAAAQQPGCGAKFVGAAGAGQQHAERHRQQRTGGCHH